MIPESRSPTSGLAWIALAAALIAGGPVPAEAQDVRGRIEGRSLDAEGRPLADTRVTATSPRLLGQLTANSNADGFFLIPALPVGTYTLRLSRPGYRELVVETIEVRLGETTALGDLVLSAGAVELETLVVEVDRPLLNLASTSIGASMRPAEFERLPTGRDYRSLTILLPHVNTSFLGDGTSAAGATGLENQYFVDGVNVTAPYKATAGTSLPYNFVKEIEVEEAGYQAEYGGGLGMRVNVVTHSGSNEFALEAFGYAIGSALAGDPKPGVADLQVESFSSYDVGLRASGPIVRDRLWYSAAYNPRVDGEDVEIPGLGFQRDRRTSHQFAGKLDWRASEAAALTFSVFGDPTAHDRVGPLSGPFSPPSGLRNEDPFLGRLRQGGVNLALHGVFRIGEDLTLEAKLGRHSRTEDEEGRTGLAGSEPLFIDRTTGVWSGGFGQRVDIASHRSAAGLSATWTTGRHSFVGGVEFQRTSVDKSEIFTEPGIIEFDGSQYITSVARNVNETRARMPSAYLQDSWRISDRLRVNAGLRWDGQFFVAAGDSVAQAFTKQWQPRVGLIFLPGEAGAQKLFAHYGRFFQRLPLSMFTIGHSLNDQRVRISDVDPRTDPDSVLFEQVIVDPCCPAVDKVEGALGEHVDEFLVGYERRLGKRWSLGVRGIYRALRDAFASGFALGPAGPEPRVGTRGNGDLSFLPPAERDYRALELTVRRASSPWTVTASYVLSKTTGNYTGQYDLDTRSAFPGIPFFVELATQAPNSSGPMPNDRAHVLKLTGAYDFGVGLDAGVFFTWQSGTPLSELGSTGFLFRPLFLSERGSAGRTPALWDLNFRFAYDLLGSVGAISGGRVVLDVVHVGNPRQVVDVDQTRFRGLDPALGPLAAFTEPYETLVANQVDPNPNYGAALRHQRPMTVRLGFQLVF